MSKKCKAYSASKLGLEAPDNRKSFYAGWDAAIAEVESQAYGTASPPAAEASVIAAAPEMLEALRNLVLVASHLDVCPGTLEEARTAIAKATGTA